MRAIMVVAAAVAAVSLVPATPAAASAGIASARWAEISTWSVFYTGSSTPVPGDVIRRYKVGGGRQTQDGVDTTFAQIEVQDELVQPDGSRVQIAGGGAYVTDGVTFAADTDALATAALGATFAVTLCLNTQCSGVEDLVVSVDLVWTASGKTVHGAAGAGAGGVGAAVVPSQSVAVSVSRWTTRNATAAGTIDGLEMTATGAGVSYTLDASRSITPKG